MEKLHKSLFYMFCFFVTNTAISQYTLIPDEEFEIKLIFQGIDTEGFLDGQILTDDIDHILLLNLEEMSGGQITDLTGIEDFVSLEELYIGGHLLETINLNNNSNLTILNCPQNNIVSLDVSNNISLEVLNISNCFPGTCNRENTISALDLSNNINLRLFSNYNNNFISSLDFSSNVLIESISSVRGSLLNHLNLKNNNNINLVNLIILENPLLTCIEVDDPIAATNASTPPYDQWDVDSNIIFSEDCSLGINETLHKTIHIYPNPVDDALNISSTAYFIDKLTIYNVSGKVVMKQYGIEGPIVISQLQAGVYNLHIETERGLVIKKLIKK